MATDTPDANAGGNPPTGVEHMFSIQITPMSGAIWLVEVIESFVMPSGTVAHQIDESWTHREVGLPLPQVRKREED